MARLSRLLTKLEDHILERARLTSEIDAIKQQILDAKTSKHVTRRGPRSTVVSDDVKALVKPLQAAGKPLLRREISSLLGLSGTSTAWRLRLALKHQFVEKTGYGLYQCAPTVPEL